MQIPGIYITHSEDKGRGVYTSLALNKNDIIEIAPVIIIPSNQIDLINQTIIYEYYFLWNQPKSSACIALGYISMYNHSENPNAEIISDIQNTTMTVKCIKAIKSGEEILINYTDNGQFKSKLWFTPSK